MVSRTNVAIIENGSWDLYYHFLGGGTFHIELFWGPEFLCKEIEEYDHVEQGRWMSLFEYESCAVVDKDKKVLLFFGGEVYDRDIPQRRAWLDLMRETWPGWDVRWAHMHVMEICDYLGVRHDELHSWFDVNEEQRFRFPKFDPGGCLLTVRRDGLSTARRVDGDIDSVELGPGHLQVLNEVEPLSVLEWEGETPHTGCHIDFDAMHMAFWSSDTTAEWKFGIREAWSGWQVMCLQDSFERHVEIAGMDIRLPKTAPKMLQQHVLEFLRKDVEYLRTLSAGHLAEEFGGDAQAFADEARQEVDYDAKMAIIDTLEKRIPVGDDRAG